MAKNRHKQSKKIKDLENKNESLLTYIEHLQYKYEHFVEYTEKQQIYYILQGIIIGYILGVVISEVLKNV